jgi:hypothetical protein
MYAAQAPATEDGIGDRVVVEFPTAVLAYGNVPFVFARQGFSTVPGGRTVVGPHIIAMGGNAADRP